MNCRIDSRNDWALRVYLEVTSTPPDESTFITLTKDDANMRHDNSLAKSELKNFRKRLFKNTSNQRKAVNKKLKFEGCGEYGLKSKRPHYHLILMGLNMYSHEYSGSISLSNKKITEMLLRADWTQNKIRNHLKDLLPVEREIYLAWQYQGSIKVLTADYGCIQYVAGHNTKSLTIENSVKKRYQKDDFYEHFQETQLLPFHSVTPGLGFDYIDNVYVPAMQRHNAYPYRHENMIFDKTKPALPLEELDTIKLSINGKKRIQKLPRSLIARIHKRMGGNLHTDEQNFEHAKYNRDELRRNMVQIFGLEHVLTLEAKTTKTVEANQRKAIKANRKYELDASF